MRARAATSQTQQHLAELLPSDSWLFGCGRGYVVHGIILKSDLFCAAAPLVLPEFEEQVQQIVLVSRRDPAARYANLSRPNLRPFSGVAEVCASLPGSSLQERFFLAALS